MRTRSVFAMAVALGVAAPSSVMAAAAEKGIGVGERDIVYVSPQDNRTVQATGSSGAKEDSRAKDEAKTDAFRNAVEKVVGVYVDTKTRAEGDDVIADRIFTKSAGYIQKYDITSAARGADGLFLVVIVAVVTEKKLANDIELLLAEKGRPKIGLLGVTTINDHKITGRPVYSRVYRFMEQKGYEMISMDYLIASEGADARFDEVMHNPIKAAKIAKKAGIEVLILCRATARHHKEVVYGTEVVKGSTQINVQAVRASNGSTLYTETMDFDPKNPSQHARLSQHAFEEGTKKAVTQLQIVADDLLPIMNIRLLQKWSQEMVQGTRIKLAVKGLSFRQRLKLKSGLQEIKGVRQVTQGRFSKEETLFDVYTVLTAEQLAASIVETVTDPSLDVTGYEEGSVTLVVVGGSRAVKATTTQ